VLTAQAGRTAARDIVRRCSDEAAQRHVAFAALVATDSEVCGHLSAAEIAAALDPGAYLGSTQEFIRRAERAHGAVEMPR
jgi:adenylosuccinate lyase